MKATSKSPGSQAVRVERAVQSGALLTAILASACCWLPLLLIAFGASGGALAARFEAVRPVLLPISLALLGLAFYFAYRKPKVVSGSATEVGESCCATPDPRETAADCCPPGKEKVSRIRKANRVVLWAVTVFVLAFTFFPNYVGVLWGDSNVASVPPDGDPVQWSLMIEGMTCQGCAAHLQSELGKTPGVSAANIAYEQGGGLVVGSPEVGEENIRKAVARAGYSVSKIEEILKTKEAVRE